MKKGARKKAEAIKRNTEKLGAVNNTVNYKRAFGHIAELLNAVNRHEEKEKELCLLSS